MNFFGFGPSAEVDIVLCGQEARKTAEIKTEEGKKERHLLYYDGETVSGKVNIQLRKPGSRLDHYGIKVELIGQIELYYDRGNHHDFLSLVKELARPGDLFQHTSYNFEFVNVEKPYESYTGANVKLRYFLRVTIVRRLSDFVKEKEIVVHTLSSYPEMNSSIKMEVGIEDCLHIEFEYNKSKYHLKDVIVGKIYFLLVRIKIKHMEIAIIKRETTGSGPNTFNENETIAKYEIMDGAPVRGESIPIRVFLAGYELTPTMKDINKKFSVRYYLNLVLVDEEDRRYFKQQEIVLWRKGDKTRKPFQAALQQQYRQMQNPNAPMTSSDQSIGGNGDATSAVSTKPSVLPNDEDGKIDVGDLNNEEEGGGGSSSSGSRNGRSGDGDNNAIIDNGTTYTEQPTPDKEFQTVINSANNKSNLEKSKIDSPDSPDNDETVAPHPAPSASTTSASHPPSQSQNLTNTDPPAIVKEVKQEEESTPISSTTPPVEAKGTEEENVKENETPNVVKIENSTESETGSPEIPSSN